MSIIQSGIVCTLERHVREKVRIRYFCTNCDRHFNADLWTGDPVPQCPHCSCAHSFVQPLVNPQEPNGGGYLNRRVCRHCGLHRKCVGGKWINADPPGEA